MVSMSHPCAAYMPGLDSKDMTETPWAQPPRVEHLSPRVAVCWNEDAEMAAASDRSVAPTHPLLATRDGRRVSSDLWGVKPARNLLMSKVEKNGDGFWLGFYIINEHEGSIATPRLDFSQ